MTPMLYHLHIHGKLLPSFKKFFFTIHDAHLVLREIIDEYFPYDLVSPYIVKDDEVDKQFVYQQIIELGHTIRFIHPNKDDMRYRRLLLESPVNVHTSLYDLIEENRDSEGIVQPFIRIKENSALAV